MKRRNFVQSLLVVPAASVAAEQAAPPTPPPQAPAPPPQVFRGAPNAQKLKLASLQDSAEAVTGFFNSTQFSALKKLAELLVPSLKNSPSALDARAPEFLDFFICRSQLPDQKLYRDGLDGINAAAKKRFHKTFAELDAKQADAIVRPLLVARAWDKEMPKDPMQHFMTRVHQDLRTATMNSAEFAAAGGASGGRGRFNSGRRMYWKPIDPRVGA